jgi:catechol 2,3-dioxygenase-like lactoylglutathione lyase family enzyme
MLADCPIHAALPATDLERARRFYAEKLGLTPESELADGLFYRCAGTRFLVYPSRGTSSGLHTQMTWHTNGIEAEVSYLKSRGVVFDEIDTPELKTINGIAKIEQSKGAWFKDSEGNVLALGQFD